MKHLLVAIFIYNAMLLSGILFWAWRNHKKNLFVKKGLPPELSDLIPPLSTKDKGRAMFWGIPVLAILLLFPLGYGLWDFMVAKRSLWGVWMDTLALFISFHLFDLVVVDWLILCFWTPWFFVVPGTEGHPGYKNYRFHLLAAIRGLWFVVAGSLVVTGLVAAVGYVGRALGK